MSSEAPIVPAIPSAEPPPFIGSIKPSRQFHQLGVLVMDGSGSMAGTAPGRMTKAQAATLATRELFTRFKVSKSVKNFSFSVVSYDTSATIHTQPTAAEVIDDNGNYDPMIGHGGGTNIASGLEKAGEIADAFLASEAVGGVPHSVVIVVMSDGECQHSDQTRRVAESIKKGPNGSRITVCSTLLAEVGKSDAAAEALLREISSDPALNYKTVYDANTLRAFFIASMSSASGVVVV